MRTLEYVVLTLICGAIAAFIANTAVTKVSNSLTRSADMIAQVGR